MKKESLESFPLKPISLEFIISNIYLVMVKKILIATISITLIVHCMLAQNSNFALTIQTTTIESPIPFSGFHNYDQLTRLGTKKDFSLEVIGHFFLNQNTALRLRTGLTRYNFENETGSFSAFSGKMSGTLQKIALGVESRRILGTHLSLRLGSDLQVGLFKEMRDESRNDFRFFIKKFKTNIVTGLHPFMGADWYIWRGLALSAELRLPFEWATYENKGIFDNNNPTPFDDGTFQKTGFGKAISSIQISYYF